jgi:hypothetical protein
VNFGTPTPVFYQIVFVLVCALVGAATGRSTTVIFLLSIIISYALFIAYVGGFGSTEALIAGLGFGVLVMIPTAMGAAAAIFIGHAIHLARQRWKEKTDDA